MGYFLMLLNLALAFIRVPEYYPELAPYRIIFWLGMISLGVSLISLFVNPDRNPTFRARQIHLMLLFWGVIALSVAATGWFGGAFLALQNFAITLAYFLLIVLNVNSLRQVRAVGILLVLTGLIMVAQGALAVHYGYMGDKFLYVQRMGEASSSLIEDPEEEPGDSGTPYGATGEPSGSVVLRIRNIGFLNDPNDLAQALLVSMPFLALGWRKGRFLRNLCLVLLPGGFLLYGVFLTRSRGGLVGLAVMLLFGFRERLGRVLSGIVTGILILGLLAMNIAGGRAFSTSESSAEGRIEAWASGLLMLREHPLLGVGFRNFTDEHPGLTAHNSFVLCFSELGLVGYSVWMTLLVLTFLELSALCQLSEEDPSTEDVRRWAGAIRLSLITFLTAAFFLSRTYIVTLYLLLGLAVAVADLARRNGLQFSPPWPRLAKTVAGSVVGSIVMVWLLVKVGS